MGLEVVLNEILARGSEEEQKIIRAAESERQRMLDAAEGEADELRAKALQEIRHKVEALRREHRSASEFEVRRQLLVTQRELAEDFRARVLKALAALDEKGREKIHVHLLKKAAKDLPEGKVHARKEDMAFLTKTHYTKGKTIEGVGGFQVESNDGTLVLDHRFETLLENAWPDIQREARNLFQV